MLKTDDSWDGQTWNFVSFFKQKRITFTRHLKCWLLYDAGYYIRNSKGEDQGHLFTRLLYTVNITSTHTQTED